MKDYTTGILIAFIMIAIIGFTIGVAVDRYIYDKPIITMKYTYEDSIKVVRTDTVRIIKTIWWPYHKDEAGTFILWADTVAKDDTIWFEVQYDTLDTTYLKGVFGSE